MPQGLLYRFGLSYSFWIGATKDLSFDDGISYVISDCHVSKIENWFVITYPPDTIANLSCTYALARFPAPEDQRHKIPTYGKKLMRHYQPTDNITDGHAACVSEMKHRIETGDWT